MNIVIISGSNRESSGSSRVAKYIENYAQQTENSAVLVDLHDHALPLWTEELWNSGSAQFENWQQYKNQLISADALVLVAAEWNGTVPPSLHNFIMHVGSEVAHKPVLLVSVSAGIGGTYPIAELKAFANKNNRMVFIPDHVIVRNVNEDFDSGDHAVGPRLKESVEELVVYAKHMKSMREEITFDYKKYKNGM